MVEESIAVLIGGAIGSLARFLLSFYVQKILPKNFPWGILTVNILGCFLAGLLMGVLVHRLALPTVYRAFIFIGFLGGFTTFSSFSLDTVLLLQSHAYSTALVNIIVSVLFGLTATAVGLWCAKFLGTLL